MAVASGSTRWPEPDRGSLAKARVGAQPMTRYGQLYIERGKPTLDSERFRNRLGAFAEGGEVSEMAGPIVGWIVSQLGCKMPNRSRYDSQPGAFFKNPPNRHRTWPSCISAPVRRFTGR